VEIHMFPLSFNEFVSAIKTADTNTISDIKNAAYPDVSGLSRDKLFAYYLEYGSFPFLFNFRNSLNNALSGWDKSSVRDYLSGIYSTIVLKDIVENKNIKEAGRLERVIKFMADTIGSETSIKRISDMLTSEGIKILPLTVESYLDAFRDSYILYKAERYDVKGRKLLKTLNKYYMVDMGLRRLLLGNKAADSGHILENIVYFELLRRGYKVYIGKVDDKEVDFAAEGPDGAEYYQVSETVRGKETLARELAPFELIRDHNPKFLLTRDYEPKTSHNGIKQINALDWLLGE